MTKEGIKYDNGKPRLYEIDNAIDRYSNALLRHLLEGDTTDKESKLLHASHVAWNALARLHFIIESAETVDVGFWDKNGVYKEDIQEVDLEKERIKDEIKE